MKRKKYDYSQKKLQNPFFGKSKKKRKQEKRKRLKVTFITFIVLILVIFLVWFFVFCSFWEIKKIEVTGLKRMNEEEVKIIAQDELKGKKMHFIPKDNMIFANASDIENNLKNKYHFKKVVVNTKIPHKLILEIKENQCAYIFMEDGEKYYADYNNYIIEHTRENVDKEELITVNNKARGRINNEKIELQDGYIEYATKFKDLIQKRLKDVKIENFFIDKECCTDIHQNLIKFKVLNGPEIHLNSDTSANKQVEKLILIKDKLKSGFWDKKYITLEYGDKVFYQ